VGGLIDTGIVACNSHYVTVQKTVKIIVTKHKTNKMESLTDSQQETVCKMSSERIQGRLMRAGLNEDEFML